MCVWWWWWWGGGGGGGGGGVGEGATSKLDYVHLFSSIVMNNSTIKHYRVELSMEH